ncbi:hypothetical protein [Dechloromonas denitrificans]|jgi:hypothetical protein|uniref:hypothetical protein n=1 Tax=Azonexaceae TaxID=2008795 RepID=UPI001CFAE4D6|nr:hypothetical protein [Dechloromonas denitrificans]UCV07473.1 hypothetical protein KI615_19115 [Dechloromonas denitrificans]
MEKNDRSDIASFPELFDGMEQFIEEFAGGIRRTGFRLAIAAIPGSALLLFALNKLP